MVERDQVLQELRRPMPAEAVLFRIDGKPNAKGIARAVIYIDARSVVARLNAVAGLDWSDDYEDIAGGVRCRLTVMGTTRADAGLIGDGPAKGPKTAHTDALKRAATKFEIGAVIKLFPRQRLAIQGEQYLRSYKDKDNREHWDLTFKAHDELRGRYRDWVNSAPVVGAYGTVEARTAANEAVEAEVNDEEGGLDAASPAIPPESRPPAPAHLVDDRATEYFAMLGRLQTRRLLDTYTQRIAMTVPTPATWPTIDPMVQTAIYQWAEEILRKGR